VLDAVEFPPPPPICEGIQSKVGGGNPRWIEVAVTAELTGRPFAAVSKYTGVLAVPFSMVRCESLSNLPNSSRGTPRPAESLRKTNELDEATSD
jgi:hypothetical protein